MINKIPMWVGKAVTYTLTFAITNQIIRLVFRSLGASFKALGILGFLSMCSFLGGIVYGFYLAGGIKYGAYALIAVLTLNMMLWGSGFYKTR